MALQGIRRSIGKFIANPIVRLLEKTHISPNAVTWLGFLITVAAAVLIALGHPFAASFVVLFAGLFDMLDGALARLTNRVSRFGGVLDSTLDRASEAVIFIGIAVLYAGNQSVWGVAVSGIALITSQLVSYVRARAEAIDVNCEVGIFTRPERVVILFIGLLLSTLNFALLVALAIIAVLSFITAIQRLLCVWQKTKSS
ncbi:MAG: CDP-alcohol phosphatidyltransferase family protein [Dehalococcoidales bacterium]|nr:CDP-alcohol phosphatidyltransferase family protein [Dehalococcoidales bacterium]